VSRLNVAIETVNRAVELHRYHEVADTMYHFFWDEFCDWYVELKKLRADYSVVLYVFEQALRLLHPVMPFITEELWQRLNPTGKSIALAAFPVADRERIDAAAESEMALLQLIVTSARTLRADNKVDKTVQLPATIYTNQNGLYVDAIQKLANIKLEKLTPADKVKLTGAVRSTPEFDLVLHLPEADTASQKIRLQKEIEQLEKLIASSERQLSDEAFLAKAPAKIIDGIRAKLSDYKAQLDKSRAAV
jgi:valyl-tRNA synthetase